MKNVVHFFIKLLGIIAYIVSFAVMGTVSSMIFFGEDFERYISLLIGLPFIILPFIVGFALDLLTPGNILFTKTVPFYKNPYLHIFIFIFASFLILNSIDFSTYIYQGF